MTLSLTFLHQEWKCDRLSVCCFSIYFTIIEGEVSTSSILVSFKSANPFGWWRVGMMEWKAQRWATPGNVSNSISFQHVCTWKSGIVMTRFLICKCLQFVSKPKWRKQRLVTFNYRTEGQGFTNLLAPILKKISDNQNSIWKSRIPIYEVLFLLVRKENNAASWWCLKNKRGMTALWAGPRGWTTHGVTL